MVLIEAMACGTPIIAYAHGSVPEIIEHGKTGFVVNSMDKAVEALRNIHLISREECRATFEKRFSDIVMAQNYMRLYERTLPKQSARAIHLTPAFRK
jgi:glycosyltransferase involved in cell wall biosynthesis